MDASKLYDALISTTKTSKDVFLEYMARYNHLGYGPNATMGLVQELLYPDSHVPGSATAKIHDFHDYIVNVKVMTAHIVFWPSEKTELLLESVHSLSLRMVSADLYDSPSRLWFSLASQTGGVLSGDTRYHQMIEIRCRIAGTSSWSMKEIGLLNCFVYWMRFLYGRLAVFHIVQYSDTGECVCVFTRLNSRMIVTNLKAVNRLPKQDLTAVSPCLCHGSLKECGMCENTSMLCCLEGPHIIVTVASSIPILIHHLCPGMETEFLRPFEELFVKLLGLHQADKAPIGFFLNQLKESDYGVPNREEQDHYTPINRVVNHRIYEEDTELLESILQADVSLTYLADMAPFIPYLQCLFGEEILQYRKKEFWRNIDVTALVSLPALEFVTYDGPGMDSTMSSIVPLDTAMAGSLRVAEKDFEPALPMVVPGMLFEDYYLLLREQGIKFRRHKLFKLNVLYLKDGTAVRTSAAYEDNLKQIKKKVNDDGEAKRRAQAWIQTDADREGAERGSTIHDIQDFLNSFIYQLEILPKKRSDIVL